MKRNVRWILLYIVCAFAGVLAGCGVSFLTDVRNAEHNNITNDNTLVRKSGDSVFFDESGNAGQEKENTSENEDVLRILEMAATIYPEPTPIIVLEPDNLSEVNSEEKVEFPEKGLEQEKEPTPEPTPEPTLEPTPVATLFPVAPLTLSQVMKKSEVHQEEIQQATEYSYSDDATQVITYPAEIFGQVPRVNQTDAYVTYFEFALNLVETIQPLVKYKGLSETSAFAKFIVKALVCGVDVQKLDINKPISRAEAALVLWLAADILGEPGSNTSSKSAEEYVTDIDNCSGAVKKSVAYLYEQRILPGHGVAGQQFYPESELETEDGKRWLQRIKQDWN